MKKQNKRVLVLMLSCILLTISLLSIGCANSEKKASKHLEQLVNMFTNISESEYEAFQNVSTDLLSETSEIPKWIYTKFKENMNENGFRVLCETSTYYIPILGYMNQKEFTLKNLDIKLADGYYTIQDQLVLSTKEQSDQEDITIEGSAQVDDDGLVNYITITNIDEIDAMLKSQALLNEEGFLFVISVFQ